MDRQNIALRKTLDQIGVKHSIKGYGYIISAVYGDEIANGSYKW